MSRIYLVDPHPCSISGLRTMIEQGCGHDVVGASTSSRRGVPEAVELGCDLLLVDIAAKDFDGPDVRRNLDMSSSVPLLAVVTHLHQSVFVQQAFACGATGYILKCADQDILRYALRTILSGETFVDPMLHPDSETRLPADLKVDVSVREMAVLKRSALGYSCKEIARDMGISPKSVETYKARVLHKLGLETRVDIVRFASVCGWLEVRH